MFRLVCYCLSLIIVLLLLPTSLSYHLVDDKFNKNQNDRYFAQNTVDLINQVKSNTKLKLSQLFEDSLQKIEQNGSSINENCVESLQSLLHSPINSTRFEWLFQLYDSSGGVPQLLDGSVASLGDFDQCLRIPDLKLDNSTSFESQFCLLTLRARRSQHYQSFSWNLNQTISHWDREQIDRWFAADNRVPITIGLCLPTTFGTNQTVQIALQSLDLLRYFDTEIGYCQRKTKDIIPQIINLAPFILVLAGLFGMVSAGTLMDIVVNTETGKSMAAYYLPTFLVQMLCSFSLISNAKLLYNFRSSKINNNTIVENQETFNDEAMPIDNTKYCLINTPRLFILDGIRVIAMLWIICSHTITFTHVLLLMKVSPVAHYPEIISQQMQNNWFAGSYVSSTYYPVSAFFLITGILITYNKKQQSAKANLFLQFIRYIMTRLFRITPSFLAIMGLTYFLQYLGSGPMFHPDLVKPFVEPCRTNFWYHFFYVHNYLDVDQRCGSHTWYLAADLQLYLVAFCILHFAFCQNDMLFTIIACIVFMVFSGAIPLGMVLFGFGKIGNFNGFVDSSIKLSMLNVKLFYYATYMHSGSFFTGILLGFLLSSEWSFRFFFKRKIIRYGSLVLSGGSILATPLAMRYFVFDADNNTLTNNNNSLTSSPLFLACCFQILSYIFNFSLASFIFVCALNPRMIVSRILAAKVFRPLATLVFSVYLLHQILIWFTLQQFRSPFVVTKSSLFVFVVLITSFSLILSHLLFFLVESPFTRIGKLLFYFDSNNHNDNNNQNNDNDKNGIQIHHHNRQHLKPNTFLSLKLNECHLMQSISTAESALDDIKPNQAKHYLSKQQDLEDQTKPSTFFETIHKSG